VTSVDMREGKTTMVTHLGMAAAERKRNVLLIDADLRRPRLHERFNVPNNHGLADLLREGRLAEVAQEAPLDTLVQPTQNPHMWLMTGGNCGVDAPGLLYSSDLDALIRRFRKDFDLVFIDTPPMMMYADARIMGHLSDGVVMVVRANTRSWDELKAANQRLVEDHIPVLGTILNDWQMLPSQARAYRKYYSHYTAQRETGANA
jgi:capsular exopolysaccharide synthesis family protein